MNDMFPIGMSILAGCMYSFAFSQSGKMVGSIVDMLKSQRAILKQKQKMDCVCRGRGRKSKCGCGVGTFVCSVCLECLFCRPCVDCVGVCSGRRAYTCDICHARSCGKFYKSPVECVLDDCGCDGWMYRCPPCYSRTCLTDKSEETIRRGRVKNS